MSTAPMKKANSPDCAWTNELLPTSWTGTGVNLQRCRHTDMPNHCPGGHCAVVPEKDERVGRDGTATDDQVRREPTAPQGAGLRPTGRGSPDPHRRHEQLHRPRHPYHRGCGMNPFGERETSGITGFVQQSPEVAQLRGRVTRGVQRAPVTRCQGTSRQNGISETRRIPRCAGGEPTAQPPRAGSRTR